MASVEENFKRFQQQLERLRAAVPAGGSELDMPGAEVFKAALRYAQAGLASMDLEAIRGAPEGAELLARAVEQLEEFTACFERLVAARGGLAGPHGLGPRFLA